MSEKILVIGACGQIGTELTAALRLKYGNENVIANDLRDENEFLKGTGPFVKFDALDAAAVKNLVEKENITTVYLLAALLSAAGEQDPKKCWELNVGALRIVLDLGVEKKLKVFWPSSIAVFGPTTPKDKTPQKTILEPATMYGITKYSGELLCQYYHNKYGLDVRSLRYPGLISWKSEPGGGTTGYASKIFYEALQTGKYISPLTENTYLPMMYMADAIRGTIEFMNTPAEKIKNRMAYNFSSLSFSPSEMVAEVKKHIPNFEISYAPDHRQAIADGWPNSIDDSVARAEWGWKPEFDLAKTAEDMVKNLKQKFTK